MKDFSAATLEEKQRIFKRMLFLSKDSGNNGLGGKIDESALRVDAGSLHFTCTSFNVAWNGH